MVAFQGNPVLIQDDPARPGRNPGRPDFMNLPFDDLAMPEILDRIVEAAEGGSFRYVVTPNVDHMLRVASRPEVADLYRGAWLCINDSRILQHLAWMSGLALPARPGSDIVAELLSGSRLDRTTPILIVGGQPGLAAEIRRLFGYRDVAQHRPPMGLLQDPEAFAATLAAVERSRAGLVFLAVGSPQQEALAAALADRGIAGGVGLCIGAALEFLVGARRRAPGWMRAASLEWAYRLLSEPGRLGRRYLVDGPKIVGVFLGYRRTRREALGRG